MSTAIALGELVEGTAGLAVGVDGGDRPALVAAGTQRRDERELGQQRDVELGGQLGTAARRRRSRSACRRRP